METYGCAKQIIIFPAVKILSVFSLSEKNRFTLRSDRYSFISFGHQDLIRTACYASKNGFKIDKFILRDSMLDKIDDHESDRISAEMLEVLNAYGEKELQQFMREDYPDNFATGVKLTSLATEDTLEFYRFGFVNTSSTILAEKLFRDAWTELNVF